VSVGDDQVLVRRRGVAGLLPHPLGFVADRRDLGMQVKGPLEAQNQEVIYRQSCVAGPGLELHDLVAVFSTSGAIEIKTVGDPPAVVRAGRLMAAWTANNAMSRSERAFEVIGESGRWKGGQ